jgi:hypothetical protein
VMIGDRRGSVLARGLIGLFAGGGDRGVIA